MENENNEKEEENIIQRPKSNFLKKMILTLAIPTVIIAADYFNVPSKTMDIYSNVKNRVTSFFTPEKKEVKLYNNIQEEITNLPGTMKYSLIASYVNKLDKDSLTMYLGQEGKNSLFSHLINNEPVKNYARAIQPKKLDSLIRFTSTSDLSQEKKLDFSLQFYENLTNMNKVKMTGYMMKNAVGLK